MTERKRRSQAWEMTVVILSLAWPTILEQVMQTAVQYIDTAMVGTLGTHATAAVGATTTVNWLINSTVSALGIGFLSFIARALGAGEERQARKIAAQTVFLVLVVGSLFTALPLTLSSRVPVWMQVEPAIRALAAQYFFILYSPMLLRTATMPTCPSGTATARPVGTTTCPPAGMVMGASMQAWRSMAAEPAVA